MLYNSINILIHLPNSLLWFVFRVPIHCWIHCWKQCWISIFTYHFSLSLGPRLKYWPHLQHYPKREALVWEVFSEIVSQNKKKQFLSAVLLVKAPIKNKQNTSKQVKFESSHVRIIHKPRTRDWGQYLSLHCSWPFLHIPIEL